MREFAETAESVEAQEAVLPEHSEKKNSKRMKNIRTLLLSLLFVGPTFILFLVFGYIVNFQSLFYSLFSFDYGNPPGTFIGFQNYAAVLSSVEFWQSLWVSAKLFLLSVLLGFWVPIVQAIFLNELGKKSKRVFRYLYVLPAALPSIANMTVWSYIWNPEYGLANEFISWFGIGPQLWLQSETQVLWCLRIGGLLGGGMNILLYSVAINGVNPEIYEAAKVDGASLFRCVFAITLPNIAYMIKLQFLLSLTGALLAFDDVYIMTKGGPGTASTTVVMNIYTKSFSQLNFGQGMAMSVVLTLITMIFVALQIFVKRRNNDG